MGIGFEFKETMSGSYCRLGAEAHKSPFAFTVSAHSPRLREFATRGVVELVGTVNAEGLAKHQPLHGTLDMGALLRRRLPYAFSFRGDDGQLYRFAGAKRVSLHRLLHSLSFLPASLYDEDGNEIGNCDLLFNVRADLWSFLRSFRPTHAEGLHRAR